MLSKCSNSACSERFLYLHSGKVFRLNPDPPLEPRSAPRSREYFWLCDSCAAQMTLVFRPGLGVIVVANQPLEPPHHQQEKFQEEYRGKHQEDQDTPEDQKSASRAAAAG